MKKMCTILGCILLVVLLAFTGAAHSGKTDSKGGHYNHSTGEYHYHHGYPAHQHTGGVCPYDFDDDTNHSSSSSSSDKAEKSTNVLKWAGIIIAILVVFCMFSLKRVESRKK